MKLSQIRKNPNNPRIIRDEKFEKLKRSIQDFPQMMELRPIIVDESGVILGGNMRYEAIKSLKMAEVPDDWVKRVEELTEDQKKEFIVKDNVGFGDWDWDAIANEWDDLPLDDWGLDVPGFEAVEPLEATEDNFDTTPPIEAKTVLGDLYEIGHHRLLCGDSTNITDVERLMNGEKADMVFTDPPYGVSYTGGVIHGNKINTNHKREALQNDDVDIYEGFINLLPMVINQGAIYIFYASRNAFELFKPLKANNIEIMSVLAWIKINTGYADMNSHYKNRYEPFVYCKIGERTNFIGSTTENTTWEIEKDRDNKFHPTQKPIAVPFRAIKNHQAERVLDFFLGSGSTMVAGHQLNRRVFGMELSPNYCDVIVKRMKTLDSSLVIKRNGEVCEDFDVTN